MHLPIPVHMPDSTPRCTYAAAAGTPVCRLVQWHDVSFGSHLWDLPRLAQPLEASAETRAAVFLAALLQGGVLPCLAGELSLPLSIREADL